MTRARIGSIDRTAEPKTRRRRVPREVFEYPGIRNNYLAQQPDRPEMLPGDPATLERLRTAKSRADRIRARGPERKRRS